MMRRLVDYCSATSCGSVATYTAKVRGERLKLQPLDPDSSEITRHANLGDLNAAIGNLQRPEYRTEPGAGPHIAKPYNPGF